MAVVLQILLLVVLLVSAIYGLYANFLPSFGYGLVVVLLSVPLCWYLFKHVAERELIYGSDFSPEKKAISRRFIFGLIYLLCVLALLYGLPVVAHQPFADEITFDDVVAAKDSIRQPGCDVQISIAEHASPFQDDLCVDRAFFDSVKIGSPIVLTGSQSPIGINIDDIKIKPNGPVE